ncbi:hypothetical protein CTAYLR_007355 [Chrysophaeum taylorii]|uniref:Non-structural maintenance of chromosomes element 4 n=1 Tax=Chrysophaeum taylorii TaxID=2483200 RepID=A0AAD7UJY5_9STRA|nr:hypothetical protein CTAYLR_007355 [Chrysophaeum taylorii]
MTGQSEEERRALRAEQRALLDRITDRSAELSNLESDILNEERNNNNSLFKKVRFTRELGNDGENLVAISGVAVKRSAQLSQSVSQYSSSKICERLRLEYGGHEDGLWLGLGREVSSLFRTVPRLDFLCGPLQKPEKVKKVAQRRSKRNDDDEDIQETQYETVDQSTKTKRQEEATNHRLQHLLHTLKAKGAKDSPVDVFDLCVNPESFHETVENFFDLSFLVKDSKAGLAVDGDTGLPTARLTDQPEEALEKKQTVVVLGPQDIASIAQAWEISRPTLARTHPKRSDDDDDDDAE